MGFFRQEDWSGLPFPLSEGLPGIGLNPCLLYLLHRKEDSLLLSNLGSPYLIQYRCLKSVWQVKLWLAKFLLRFLSFIFYFVGSHKLFFKSITPCQSLSLYHSVRAKGDPLGKEWLAEKADWLETAGFMGKPRLKSRDFRQANKLGAIFRKTRPSFWPEINGYVTPLEQSEMSTCNLKVTQIIHTLNMLPRVGEGLQYLFRFRALQAT